jgi:hypothetical protein
MTEPGEEIEVEIKPLLRGASARRYIRSAAETISRIAVAA